MATKKKIPKERISSPSTAKKVIKKSEDAELKTLTRDAEEVKAKEEEGKAEFSRENP